MAQPLNHPDRQPPPRDQSPRPRVGDLGQHPQLLAAATRAATLASPGRAVATIVLPLLAAIALTGALLLAFSDQLADPWLRGLLLVPGIALAPWLGARMRARWLAPHVRAILRADGER